MALRNVAIFILPRAPGNESSEGNEKSAPLLNGSSALTKGLPRPDTVPLPYHRLWINVCRVYTGAYRYATSFPLLFAP